MSIDDYVKKCKDNSTRDNPRALTCSLVFMDDFTGELTKSGRDFIDYYFPKWIFDIKKKGKEKAKKFYTNAPPLVQAYIRNKHFYH